MKYAQNVLMTLRLCRIVDRAMTLLSTPEIKSSTSPAFHSQGIFPENSCNRTIRRRRVAMVVERSPRLCCWLSQPPSIASNTVASGVAKATLEESVTARRVRIKLSECCVTYNNVREHVSSVNSRPRKLELHLGKVIAADENDRLLSSQRMIASCISRNSRWFMTREDISPYSS